MVAKYDLFKKFDKDETIRRVSGNIQGFMFKNWNADYLRVYSGDVKSVGDVRYCERRGVDAVSLQHRAQFVDSLP